METLLPRELTEGATLQGNEYGWLISEFPFALARAPRLGYACLGGQFQYRHSDGAIYEMYWLEADSSEREPTELWEQFAQRSCEEVSTKYHSLLQSAGLRKATKQSDSKADLVFVAYFVMEAEWIQLRERVNADRQFFKRGSR